MASTSNNNMINPCTNYGSDPNSPNTTFVQADPSTFRTIVQKLTGAPDDPSIQKLPVTHPTRHSSTTNTSSSTCTTPPGPKRPAFKLQERRQTIKNLQINLNNNNYCYYSNSSRPSMNNNSFEHPDHLFQVRQRGFLVSPVSPLDFLGARVASPRSPCEEEEKAIAEKGFYFHPSPLSTPRGADPPELLPLFPLQSPREIMINQNPQKQEDEHNSSS